jgi:cell division protease FtsH
LQDISAKKVSEVYVTSSPEIKVILKNDAVYITDNPRTSDFKEMLLKSGVKVSENSFIPSKQLVPACLLVLSILFIGAIFLKNSKLSTKSFVKLDSLENTSSEKPKLTFQNVAGNEEAKESVNDVVDFLKNPEKYAQYGARLPRGIILYGEPGTGKTLLAKAVAGEAGVPFYAMSGSDFIQVYVGVGASRIRQLFKKAKAKGKAVIFIDEIDAIGKKRDSSKNGGSDERDQTLNALLTEMSGFNDNDGIVVMAATNRLDMLDSALLRPGRFDRHIEIMLPDKEARAKILSLHLQNKPVKNLNIKEWASKTTYFSGAKLESMVNEAAIIACKSNSPFIEDIHLDKAYSIVLTGYEKKNRSSISELDKKITAYHEIGHTILSLKLLPNEKISKVTIIPSTKGAGGYTMSIPEETMFQSKDYLKRRIKILLGGRAAEEMIFGKDNITTGAFSDIKKSTELVKNMISSYGMGDVLGLLNLGELSDLYDSRNNEVIDECKELISDLYKETLELINSNPKLLERLTSSLLKKETLIFKDIEEITRDN